MNYQEKQMPVAAVTGSSSGIGYETFLLLAKNHYRTYATMRNLNKSKVFETALKEKLPITIAQVDVKADSSVNNAIDTILKENGRIDPLSSKSMFNFVTNISKVQIS
jgi:NAD(P)-dependent dehydrogenase (short-subunit alcohol dehydrogenase family)